jgi:glutathionylspermidine synthase
MYLPLDIHRNVITDANKQAILASYKEMMIDYMDLTVSEKRFYFTHDMIGMSLERFVALMGDLFLLNQSIIKKTVFHLVTQEPEALSALGFTPMMQDVVQYTFSQMQCEKREDLVLSYYGRYDLIIDTQGRPQIVELNSETPAGYPESVTTNIIFDHISLQNLIDVNQDFEKNLEKSLHHKLEAMRQI